MPISLTPKRAKDYPYYILFYWIALWCILMFVSIATMLPHISRTGYSVELSECKEYETRGRFDETEECVEYGERSYKPVGKAIKDNFISKGIFSLVLVLLFGSLAWADRRKKERETPEVWKILETAIAEGKIKKDRALEKFRDYQEGHAKKSDIVWEIERDWE